MAEQITEEPEVRILRFVTSSDTERLRIEADGRIVLPTGSPGIAFDSNDTSGANVTSKTISDYEEGTWTPTVIGSTTAGSATYTIQTGVYTKIGRLVTIQCRVNWECRHWRHRCTKT